MALPIFFHADLPKAGAELWLNEQTAKHVVQVLRMHVGSQLRLSDGKGRAALVTIAAAEKKKCKVIINTIDFFSSPVPLMHIAIAFTKNAARNEWLLEKATELGVRSIIPLLAKRTVKEKIRYDRWHNILVSAMMQSQQYYLPLLEEAMPLEAVVNKYREVPQRLMAHCMEEKERKKLTETLNAGTDTLLLIGPEGDFAPEEVTLCETMGYTGVSLGSQRLRTETAAMAACAYFNVINNA